MTWCDPLPPAEGLLPPPQRPSALTRMDVLTYLLTHLLTYILTYLLTYSLTYLHTHLFLACSLTHLLTHFFKELFYSLWYLPYMGVAWGFPTPLSSDPKNGKGLNFRKNVDFSEFFVKRFFCRFRAFSQSVLILAGYTPRILLPHMYGTYLLTHLLDYLLTRSRNYLTYLFTYALVVCIYLLTYLLTYPLTYLLTHLLSYSVPQSLT